MRALLGCARAFMLADARIALVWQCTTPVADLCTALCAAQPDARVTTFVDLITDGDALRRLRPHVLVVAVDAPSEELAGSLRLLSALLPGAGLVLATPQAQEEAAQRMARRLGAALLVLPSNSAAVAAALASALRAEPASESHAMLSLVRGIADEVNNPLLGALGQLRLLESELASDEAKLTKAKAASRALRRIQGTLERARALLRSGHVHGALLPVDVGALLREMLPGTAFAPAMVLCDRDLLRTALRNLSAVGRDLASEGHAPTYSVEPVLGDTIVRLEIAATRLADWQLPRTFEPYYLSRMLRGTSHGLSLFCPCGRFSHSVAMSVTVCV